MPNPIPAGFLNFPIVDPQTGRASIDFLRFLQNLITQTMNLNLDGSINGGSGGDIDPSVLAAQVANLDANGIVLPNGVDLSRAYINKFLQYIPDGGGRFAVTNMAGGNAVSSVDGSNKALIDFSQAGHTNKNLDNIADSAGYSRTLAAYVSSGVPYNFQGTWNSATAYPKGAEVTNGSNYWLALVANTNSAPAIGNANWQLLGPVSLDDLGDGATYSRTLGAYVSSGVPYNFQGAWSSVTAYPKGAEVSYLSNYWLALASNTNSAPAIGNANWQLLGPVSLDDLNDGAIYSRIKAGYLSTGQLLANEFPGAITNTDGSISGSNGITSSRVLPVPISGSIVRVTMVGQKSSSADDLGILVNSTGSVIYKIVWQGDNNFVLYKNLGSGYVAMANQVYSTSDTNPHSITLLIKAGSPNSLSAQIDGTNTITATEATSMAGALQLSLACTGKLWEFDAHSDQVDTLRVLDNAISQAASGSTGVVNGTVNVWMNGASAALAGGGTATTISFYFTLENGSAVAQAMNWRVLRNATVLISGSTTVGPGGSTFQLLPANIIDVGPPSGTNTYQLQCEFTTGPSAITGFQSSNIAITNLSK